MDRFSDRTDAGTRLATLLQERGVTADIVLAIPRGGLPVGRAVADRFGAPLDVVAARKIGAPDNPELAIGAVASDGTRWLNDSLIEALGVDREYIDEQTERERAVAQAKTDRYREGRPPLDLQGQRVVLVDDGIATGATTIACLREIASAGAEWVTLAVPVAPPDAPSRLQAECDAVVALWTPPQFNAVGQFYDDFSQVSDTVAKEYLREER